MDKVTHDEDLSLMHIRPYEIISDGTGLASVRVIGHCTVFDLFCVPVGFECDGASIPRWLWWLCGDPFEEPRIFAAIVHDWLYANRAFANRSECDKVYKDLLIGFGIPRWRAEIEYIFVRLCGWMHWIYNG